MTYVAYVAHVAYVEYFAYFAYFAYSAHSAQSADSAYFHVKDWEIEICHDFSISRFWFQRKLLDIFAQMSYYICKLLLYS